MGGSRTVKTRINNWLAIFKGTAVWNNLRSHSIPAHAFGEAMLLELEFGTSEMFVLIATPEMLAVREERMVEGVAIAEYLMVNPMTWEELESE